MDLQFWFMFPISIMVATVAMASGVEGATFFAPIFILLLGLPPEVAIGAGLITEVFGFASGLYSYRRKRLIDYQLGMTLLMVTIPLAVFGTMLSAIIDPVFIKFVLGVGLLSVGVNFLWSAHHKDHKGFTTFPAIRSKQSPGVHQRRLITASGEEICYEPCNHVEGRVIAGVGSLFMGMVATGLGEMNGYYMLRRCQMPARIAVATSVFVVAVTALTASIGHIVKFLQAGGDSLATVFALVIFTVPGVIIGGQIGPIITSRISQQMLERTLGILFIVVAMVLLGDVLI